MLVIPELGWIEASQVIHADDPSAQVVETGSLSLGLV